MKKFSCHSKDSLTFSEGHNELPVEFDNYIFSLNGKPWAAVFDFLNSSKGRVINT